MHFFLFRVKHVLVRTKQELQIALRRCLYESTDSIVEIASSISENAEFHRSQPHPPLYKQYSIIFNVISISMIFFYLKFFFSVSLYSILRDSASEVINQTMEYISWGSQSDNEEKNHMPICRILKAEYTSFRYLFIILIVPESHVLP